MFDIFKNKEKSNSQIFIECHKDQIKINGLKLSFPIDLDTLKKVLWEPSKQEYDLIWIVVWDDLGIYTKYGNSNNILGINFLLSNNHKLKHFPKSFFTGQIKVDDREVTNDNFKEFDLNKYKAQKLTYKGYVEPYSISIGENLDYKEEIPKNKYIIKDTNEELIEFSDFGFKLCIVQELMYKKKLLEPKFDVFEFVEWYDKRKINLETEGYEPIPEITQYFKDLQISKRFASEITEIYQDGGNDIYMQLLRFGEGWEKYWDIENTKDLQQFPNLKKIVLCYAKNNVIAELNDMGIEAKWI